MAHVQTLQEPAICFHAVTLAWQSHVIIPAFSGQIAQGSMTAVVGPNGAGKSTLFKGIMGFIKPASGHIHFATGLKNSISILPQSQQLERNFPITTYDVVAMGAWREVGAFGRFTKALKEKVEHTLARVGLSDCRHRLLGELSGGQMQRALFARLMMTGAKILLLDEPFVGVDAYTRDALLKLLHDWNDEGRTILCVLHDDPIVKEHFPQTLLLSRGVVAWGCTHEVMSEEHLLEAYQRKWEEPGI